SRKMRETLSRYSDETKQRIERAKRVEAFGADIYDVPIQDRRKLVQKHPGISKLSRTRFEWLEIPTRGTTIRGLDLLEHYGVVTQEEYLRFLSTLFPDELRAQVASQ